MAKKNEVKSQPFNSGPIQFVPVNGTIKRIEPKSADKAFKKAASTMYYLRAECGQIK